METLEETAELLQPIVATLSRAIQEEITPGAAFYAGDRRRGVQTIHHVGQLSYRPLWGDQPSGILVGDQTYFDLASLTKPLATGLWFWTLVSTQALDPHRPIGDLIACEDEMIAQAPMWRLVNHSAGLPPHFKYYSGLGGSRMSGEAPLALKAMVRRMISHTPSMYLPGEKSVYSDLGYLALEAICERLSGMTLSTFWTRTQQARIAHHQRQDIDSARGLHFVSLEAIDSGGSTESQGDDMGSPALQYAPTERCPWRNRLLCGEVHDDNAWLIGGVGGHAGLFGRLQDVAEWAWDFMDAYHGRPSALPSLRADILQRACELSWRAPQAGSYVLGWDTPSAGYTSAGALFSPKSVGHLGFTGTSLWMDLEAEVVMILLTNRVHPTRERGAEIRWLRPALHDATWRALKAFS